MLKKSLNKIFKSIPSTEGNFVYGLIVSLLLVNGCSSNGVDENKGKLLAKVGEVELYEEGVYKKIGEKYSDKEELKAFVNNWTLQQSSIEKAKSLLTEQEQDFESELNSYNNSLLSYALEQKIIQKELDIAVHDSDVNNYYKENLKNFELKQNIVKVRYVKVPRVNKDLSKLKYLIQYKDSLRQVKFFKIVDEHNLFCEVKDSNWVDLENLKSLIPIKLYNDEHFLSHYRYTEAPEKDYLWIVYFTAHKLKDEVSPLDLVKDQIVSAIINQRKIRLLKEKEKEFYLEAKKNGQIKVYLD